MKQAINQLTKALTGKEHLEECSETELKQMVRLYPYFAPAHLLLARKAGTSDPETAETQRKQASLYFSNPLWLNKLMTETETGSENEPAGNTPEEVTKGAVHDTILETPATREEVVVQPAATEPSPAAETSAAQEILPSAITETTIDTSADAVTALPPAEPLPSEVPEVEAAREESETAVPEPGDEEEAANEEEPGMELPAIKLPSFTIEPLDPQKMELSFEPYHTVDYFASQGIRFKEEEKPQDRLGHQLKSFTEWLKTLKKLPPSEIPVTATRQEEKKVEQMAEISLADREVVTEAMAEVWEKQGNAKKALELYKKLSLLDPAKSSYFAAKIEFLKQL